MLLSLLFVGGTVLAGCLGAAARDINWEEFQWMVLGLYDQI